MNSTQSARTDFDQLFYEQLGSTTILMDAIQLYFFIPFSFICLILNLLSLLIVGDKNKCNGIIYNQLKVYIRLNILLCSIVFLFAFVNIPRYASFSYSYPARIYSCVFMFPLLIFSYSYYLFISIFNILYRLSLFVTKFRIFEDVKEYKLGLYGFITFILVNIPLALVETAQSQSEFDEFRSNISKLDNLKLCIPTSFSQSSYSKTLVVVIFGVNYILLILTEMILVSSLIYYFNKFLKYKFGLFRNFQTIDQIFKAQLNQNNKNRNNNKNNNQIVVENDDEQVNQNEPVGFFSKILFSLGISNVIFNLFLILFGILIVLESKNKSSLIYNISFYVINLMILLKHGNTFFILFKYDSNFKFHVKNLIKCSR
jgi:hypothetical protein